MSPPDDKERPPAGNRTGAHIDGESTTRDHSAGVVDAPRPSLAKDGLTRNERYEFRLMAKYPEIVERVIAESTDQHPASRRWVMREIRAHIGATP